MESDIVSDTFARGHIPLATEQAPEDLFGILEATRRLGGATTVLLAKLVVFVSEIWVRQDLVRNRDLLELGKCQ